MELKKFCSAPFSTLIINADGKVGCCREKGTEHVVGDAFTQTIEEIWNGEAIKAWRREFLTGNIETCKKEQHDMSCNLFKHNLEVLPYIEFDEVQNGPVLRLSPDFNGRCNLKCPMCIVWKKPNGKYDLIPNFWEISNGTEDSHDQCSSGWNILSGKPIENCLGYGEIKCQPCIFAIALAMAFSDSLTSASKKTKISPSAAWLN